MSEWIDNIPEGWSELPLKRWVDQRITDGPHETPALVDDGVPFVSAEAIQDGRVVFEKQRGFISAEAHRAYCRKCKPERATIPSFPQISQFVPVIHVVAAIIVIDRRYFHDPAVAVPLHRPPNVVGLELIIDLFAQDSFQLFDLGPCTLTATTSSVLRTALYTWPNEAATVVSGNWRRLH